MSTYKYSNDFYEWKINKRNQLVKRVRENYVRKNISCGFTCCKGKYTSFVVYSIVSKEIMEKHKSLLKSDFIKPIICQSEFSSLTMGDQKRIKDIMSKKSYSFFYDTFFEETVNKGLEGVLEYYQKHLPEKNFIILNDNNIKLYPGYFEDPILADLVDDVYIKENTDYNEYYKNVEELYNNGLVYKSTLMVDQYNWRNGTIFSQNKRIRILGSLNMNRAIHGDEVYVEIIEEECKDEIDNPEEVNIKNNVPNVEVNSELIFGRVVGISKRGKTELIGTILNNTVNGDGPQNVLVLPIDKKYPPVRIRTSQIEELINRRLWIELEFWDKDSKYPVGHYYKKLSHIGDVEGEIKCILLSNNINYYSLQWKDLVKESDTDIKKALNNEETDFYSLSSVYKECEDGIRRDLRHLDVFSVDPQGCTDVDDALHIKELENGNFEVGVHIADVSHYVKPGSTLDEISSDRGTTVYLPDRRIDMLPEFLSAGLCSLLENQERGTFSVIWEIDRDANIINTEFTKGLIKSRKAFSYDEALKSIESNDNRFLKKELVELFNISKVLRSRRQENGALDLSSSKVEVKDGKVELKESLPTYALIEEFMLLANISVAEFIYKNYPENAILRKHPPPSQTEMPIPINLQVSSDVNSVIKNLDVGKREIFKKIVTRAMNQATYCLSSEDTDFYHYGLATPLYTHFTSPIRRYADILVHRTLYHIITKNTELSAGKRYKIVKPSVEMANVNDDIVRNINKRHSSARRCAWDVNTLFIYMAIRDLEPETTAYVTDIKSNGVLIYIPEYGINEALPLETQCEVFDSLKIKILKDDETFYFRRRFNIEVIKE